MHIGNAALQVGEGIGNAAVHPEQLHHGPHGVVAFRGMEQALDLRELHPFPAEGGKVGERAAAAEEGAEEFHEGRG